MTAKPVVIRHDETIPRARGGGVRTSYLVTRERGARAFLSGVTEFDAGSLLPFHSHNCEESVVVLAGDAAFETAEEAYALRAGDTTLVPAGAVHRFRNTGSGILRILWIYGSGTPTRTLAATGETFVVGSEAEHGE